MTGPRSRILIRGGSIAAGWGVSRGYADILRDALAPRGIEVLNRSRPRDTSFDGVRTFQEDIEAFEAGILIVHFGGDDAYLSVYRSEFKENLVRIVGMARVRSDPTIVLPTSHAFEDPYERDVMDIYNRVIREVAVDLACDMVSVHTYWQGWLQENDIEPGGLLQTDVRYPSEKGHAVIAAAVLKTLEMRIPDGHATHPTV